MKRGAIYRLQLRPGFDFDAAAAAVDYLARLGVTHIYTSPLTQAVKGSAHGYDVVDHNALNAELGGEAGYRRLAAALARHGLGHILDVVPNHMAIANENLWWWDVLENGPSSPYARYFDVDWDPPEARHRNAILLPVLRDHYGRVLEAGEIALGREGVAFTVRYADHRFPANPRSLAAPLREAAADTGSDRLTFLAHALDGLPLATATDTASAARRRRDWRIALELLAELLAADARVGPAIDAAIATLNRDLDKLDAFLEFQNYRLASWQMAGRDLGYRRFFDVNSLIGLRAEDEQVFHETHRLALQLAREGAVDGLRIDHPDGLRDPEEYVRRLRAALPDTYIVLEKILAAGERLPPWPVAGTTGYDFLAAAGGLFVDPRGETPLTDLYTRFTGESGDWAKVAHDARIAVLRDVLGSDVNRLTEVLIQVCERHRRHRDYTRHQLAEALREMLAGLSVYRTYVRPAHGVVSDADQAAISGAAARARLARPDLDAELFGFICRLLSLETKGEVEAEFAWRFQQLSGPVMAKGVEDTAFYVYNRFVALNEVGGDPGRFGLTLEAFHQEMAVAQEHRPLSMLATATHDTKRGEDVRARLYLLSEIPEAWGDAVTAWAAMNERHREADAPTRNDEYLLYQTLVGAWPLEADRAERYMEKAAREAKTFTSWVAPNAGYEDALRGFVRRALGDPLFMRAVDRFTERLVAPGRVVALAQTLLKLTAPGIPDLFQGTETWSHVLVDPDNRRPVDYAARRALLDRAAGAAAEDALAGMDEGLPKLWLIREALALRARRPEAFGPEGTYAPLAAEGPKARHAVAFARGGEVVTVVPRLVIGLGADWCGTTLELPEGEWRSVLTGEPAQGAVSVQELLARFPVALLERARAR